MTCRYNSAKKDNDFIYHEPIPPTDTLTSVKGNRRNLQSSQLKLITFNLNQGTSLIRFSLAPPGAPLVKALPVNPTDPSVTGPDLFAKLVPMAAHEASSLYRYAAAPRQAGGTPPCLTVCPVCLTVQRGEGQAAAGRRGQDRQQERDARVSQMKLIQQRIGPEFCCSPTFLDCLDITVIPGVQGAPKCKPHWYLR